MAFTNQFKSLAAVFKHCKRHAHCSPDRHTGNKTFPLMLPKLLNNEPMPSEAKDHALQAEWSNFRELHLGGDSLLIYQADEESVYLTRLGSHAQLFKSM